MPVGLVIIYGWEAKAKRKEKIEKANVGEGGGETEREKGEGEAVIFLLTARASGAPTILFRVRFPSGTLDFLL